MWKEERMQLAEQIREEDEKVSALRVELAKVDDRLRAAMLFVPELQDWFDQEDEKQMGQEVVPLTDAIIRFLTANKGRVFPRDTIKANLQNFGYAVTKLNANPNYLYTALKRLIKRDEIVEAPPGHFRLK
jgi:hypothetical protein